MPKNQQVISFKDKGRQRTLMGVLLVCVGIICLIVGTQAQLTLVLIAAPLPFILSLRFFLCHHFTRFDLSRQQVESGRKCSRKNTSDTIPFHQIRELGITETPVVVTSGTGSSGHGSSRMDAMYDLELRLITNQNIEIAGTTVWDKRSITRQAERLAGQTGLALDSTPRKV